MKTTSPSYFSQVHFFFFFPSYHDKPVYHNNILDSKLSYSIQSFEPARLLLSLELGSWVTLFCISDLNLSFQTLYNMVASNLAEFIFYSSECTLVPSNEPKILEFRWTNDAHSNIYAFVYNYPLTKISVSLSFIQHPNPKHFWWPQAKPYPLYHLVFWPPGPL